jgi:DNA-directed RNA polymerase specialized sigma24 family protein
MSGHSGDPPVGARTAADTATRLLARAQAGDADALNDLFSRHVPLLVARLELGLTYEEMAEALGKPSWNAARMAVARALMRLASELKSG